MARNYFKETTFRGRPIQVGRLESLDAIRLAPGDVTTHVLDMQGDQATAICVIPGLWAPEIGTPIQLQEPERVATVRGLAYVFDGAGFSVSVWVEDPLTQGGDA